jgi:hypothetical protein
MSIQSKLGSTLSIVNASWSSEENCLWVEKNLGRSGTRWIKMEDVDLSTHEKKQEFLDKVGEVNEDALNDYLHYKLGEVIRKWNE